jgi:hypothetical protein
MSQMCNLPPIAGAIIWARQIERQLLTYMKRVEDVLGKGWELYAEGQKLQSESRTFRTKFDTRPVYDAWLHDINRRDMGVNGRLFEIVRLRGGGFQLAVNFDPQVITLFKEVRNLLWLNFQVPHAITNMAKDAERVYPHAVSLMDRRWIWWRIIRGLSGLSRSIGMRLSGWYREVSSLACVAQFRLFFNVGGF